MGTTSGVDRALRALDQFRHNLGEIAVDEIDTVKLERDVQRIMNDVGREMMREIFQRADEVAPEVLINGETWGNRRLVKATYRTIFGEFEVVRSVYQKAGRGEVAVPMELRLRIVEGTYTPVMSRVMSRVVALVPPADGEGLLEEIGVAKVSVSTLHRIPCAMAARYERERAVIEPAVRERDIVPPGAHVVQVGLDGVMVPQDGEHAKPRGRRTSTPAPSRHETRYGSSETPSPADEDDIAGRAWHEASVGTLAFWNADGEHLRTIYIAEMPESKKAGLVRRLEDELQHVVAQRPDLEICAASDGAPTHWDALEGIVSRLPKGQTEPRFLVDFYHVAGYVADAANAAAGAGTTEAESLRCFWSDTLRVFGDGGDRVLRMMRYRRDRAINDDAREIIDGAIQFIGNQAQHGRTNYASALAKNLPIGTGVTEAAAKTVVNVRMKRAGARYSQHGGQTVLLFRSAVLSERFHILSDELESTYGATVKRAA